MLGDMSTCARLINEYSNEHIVSEDSHFNVLKSIPFPRVEVKRLQVFYDELVG